MAAIFILTKVQEVQTPSQHESLIATLNKEFPERWFALGNENYLVATSKPLITPDITKLTGVVDGAQGSYLVTNLDSYYGWANASIWEWIKAMRELDGQA